MMILICNAGKVVQHIEFISAIVAGQPGKFLNLFPVALLRLGF